MKSFGFSFKNKDEVFIKKDFSSEEEAVLYFSKIKNLSIDSFLEIFEIKSLKKCIQKKK